MARRSILFSPGDQPELMRKAPDAGADTIIFDLEDAVSPGSKDEGREAVADVLTDPAFDPDCEVGVRVNARAELVAEDVDAVVTDDARLDVVMRPKTESTGDVAMVTDLLDEQGATDLPLIALCESAPGVLHAEDIAASGRVDALAFGAEDLSADVGATRTDEGTEVLYAREHVVLAAAAADVEAIDTVFTDFGDAEGLADDTEFALELGYDGKMCIHPAQVEVVNEAFTPSEERVAWARKVLDAAADADAEGVGVFEVDGEMIDAPLVSQAELVRARARAADVW